MHLQHIPAKPGGADLRRVVAGAGLADADAVVVVSSSSGGWVRGVGGLCVSGRAVAGMGMADADAVVVVSSSSGREVWMAGRSARWPAAVPAASVAGWVRWEV